MRFMHYYLGFYLLLLSESSFAQQTRDISHLISKAEFLNYQNVADFIDASPQVTIVVPLQTKDVDQYGREVIKTLTGSDCDRDGKMDSNATCNAVYLKLWLKYQR